MIKVALLSDTHSYLDPRVEKHLTDVDEIWHAGDIGDLTITDQLSKITKLRAVYGNIDNHLIRVSFPKELFFEVEKCKVYITHISGNSKNYTPHIHHQLLTKKPQLFICGHSHILKVFFNAKYQCLHLNPGAIGTHGFHAVQTLLKFEIDKGNIQNLNIVELTKK